MRIDRGELSSKVCVLTTCTNGDEEIGTANYLAGLERWKPSRGPNELRSNCGTVQQLMYAN